jgi:hypothetical protein
MHRDGLMEIMTIGARRVVRVERHDELSDALLELDLVGPRPVLVSVGGAGGTPPQTLQAISAFFTERLVPLFDTWGVAVVDGGTDSGVMHAMGQARRARGARFPLVGIAAEGTVMMPGGPPDEEGAALEPNHSHVVLVPGSSWGDESPWLSDAASAMSGGAPSVTLLTNGGEISYDDATRSVESDRPLIVLAGTGRTADAIAGAVHGESDDARARTIAASPLTRVVPLAQPEAVLRAVADALGKHTR